VCIKDCPDDQIDFCGANVYVQDSDSENQVEKESVILNTEDEQVQKKTKTDKEEGE
jgi:hypothetical protein